MGLLQNKGWTPNFRQLVNTMQRVAFLLRFFPFLTWMAVKMSKYVCDFRFSLYFFIEKLVS